MKDFSFEYMYMYKITFSNYEAEFVLFVAVLENSVLPTGCDSCHETLKVTSEI